MKLLTTQTPKTEKAGRFGCLNAVLYLTPGHERCPSASPGCLKACLNTSGRGVIPGVQKARYRRTMLLKKNPLQFYLDLYEDLQAFERQAMRLVRRPVVRLNGTSDLIWDDVYMDFPNIQFVEYTKRFERVRWAQGLPKNLHLSFSRSENNDRDCVEALRLGVNVCVVFDVKKGVGLPIFFKGRPVIDGDLHDLRFLDPRGAVVGLRVKGRGSKDRSGFVVPGIEDPSDRSWE